ncbi:hypothetical protein H310_01444 [Aphanomyces invadans]|uniref:Myosin motor domain-containing protein n=1 Tax=Aphanomyces invadans TaxID=157072 RepID=A0A024URB5_9STRA|nr:hypothetical protein H310_01444 [Aphanomyces invadans]ETW08966.1 hypothetical protein H310_01444 [Aphanomyces invadans]|eukprot:XP_008862771.1 hypothetical protein H310_01444 [Aphanomyces invadans]
MALPFAAGALYWKKAGDTEWVLGRLADVNADKSVALFEFVDEDSGDVLPNEPDTVHLSTESLVPANPLFTTYPDMTSLRHMNEPSLVKNVFDRWNQNDCQPYTRVSNILIAVNPLRRLPVVDKLPFVHQSLDKSPPHPFHIAENAYRQMRSVKQNQSIVISGESGSGKTETSKIILNYLTDRSTIASSDVYPTAPGFQSNQDEMSQISMANTVNNQDAEREHALGDRLMETIPILESFGNAKTHRNHNSSRFGKYMRLQFTKMPSGTDLHLSGASIDTYLLETSRLVQTPAGERNFHVFYELLQSGDAKYLNELKLVPNPYLPAPEKSSKGELTIDDCIAQYNYLNRSACWTSEFVQDKANFQKLVDALEYVNIDSDELFRVVSGLLHLGNLTFDEEDTQEGTTATLNQHDPAQTGPLDVAAELLGLDPDTLMDAILKKKISRMANEVVGDSGGGRPSLQRAASVFFLKKDTRQASYSRDTIAKTIYDQVFGFLMMQCANALEFNVEKKDELPYIGVLDIFGFEDFEPNNRNSLEQLMINYANETLQNMFNQCILKNEFELYHLENIFAPQNAALRFPIFPPAMNDHSNDSAIKSKHLVVQYDDNKDCLNLIAAKNEGMFSIIDTVGKLAGPSDRKLNETFRKLFSQHPCFIEPHPRDAKHTFIIKHFAGTVRYNITSFLDKNNNVASTQFDELMQSSSLKILKTPLNRPVDASNNRRRGVGPANKPAGSVTQIFSQQMKGLAVELESTRSNFIRCIKPNATMDPKIFNRPSVVQQLRCSGTVQACQVLQVGLPTRVSYEELIDTYIHLLGMDFMVQFHDNGRLFARALCYVLEFPTDDYRLGDTKLFFKTGKIHLLDTVLNVTPKLDTEELETRLLQYTVKRRWITAVTKVVVQRLFEKIFLRVQLARRALVLQCWFRQILATKLVKKMRTQIRVSKAWNALCSKVWVQHAFENSVDDKLVFLQTLLRQKDMPSKKKWLLTWLGPLERSMYVKKLGKAACMSYLAKRAFLSLLEKVREKRACVKIQSHMRRVLATKEYLALRQHQKTTERWNLIRNWVKGRFCFLSLFRKAHVARLERDNISLRSDIDREKAKNAALAIELSTSKDLTSSLQNQCFQLESELAECKANIAQLAAQEVQSSLKYQMTQELVDLEVAKNSDLEEANAKLHTTNTTLVVSLKKTESDLEDSCGREKALKQVLQDKHDQLNLLLAQVDCLQSQFAAATSENDALKVSLEKTESDLEDACGREKALKQELQNKHDQLNELLAQVDSLQSQFAAATFENDVLKAWVQKYSQLEAVNSNLARESERRASATADANAKNEELEHVITQGNLQICDLTNQIHSLQAKLDETSNDLATANTQILVLESAKLLTQGQLASMAEELEASTIAVRQKSDSVDALEATVEALRGQLKEAQVQDKLLKDKLFTLRAEKSKQPAPVDMAHIELTTKLAHRESQIALLTAQLQQMQSAAKDEAKAASDLAALEGTIAKRDSKIETLKALLKQCQVKKEKLLHEAKSSQGLLDKVIKEHEERQQRAANEYEAKIAELAGELAALKEQGVVGEEERPVYVDVHVKSNVSDLHECEESDVEPRESPSYAFFETKTTASLAVVLTAVVVREFVKARFG